MELVIVLLISAGLASIGFMAVADSRPPMLDRSEPWWPGRRPGNAA